MDPAASQNMVIRIWPGEAPGSEGWTQVEEETILPPDLKVVRNVTQPSLTVYPADPAKVNGTAVIVCPGGAWHFLSIDKEGTDVASWLARGGVTAFVLRYRLLRTGDHLREEMNANLSNPARIADTLQDLFQLARMDGQQPVNIDTGFYKIGNLLWHGIYMHANHHKRAGLFNPAKMENGLPLTVPGE